MKNLHLFFAAHFVLFLVSIKSYALPYDWKEGVSGIVTRCFETRFVKVHCEDFSEPEWGKKKFEELQIEGKDLMRRKFFYSYERAIPGNLCQEHFSKIHSLLRNAKEVCITGGLEWVHQHEDVTNSKWMALETRNGRVVR